MSLPQLPAVENTQHHEPLAIVTVTKNVTGIEHIEDQFSKLRATCHRPADLRMFGKDRGLGLNFRRDDCREAWMPVMQERGETIEVSERGR